MGGESRRMGRDKALLQFGAVSLAERLLGVLSQSCDELLLVGGAEHRFSKVGLGARWVADAEVGRGPLRGVLAALRAAQGGVCVVLACDLPFVTSPLVDALLAAVEGHDAAAYPRGAGFEPLLACYRPTAIPPLEEMLVAGEYRAATLLDRLRVRGLSTEVLDRVDPNRIASININQPDDLERALSLLGNHDPGNHDPGNHFTGDHSQQ